MNTPKKSTKPDNILTIRETLTGSELARFEVNEKAINAPFHTIVRETGRYSCERTPKRCHKTGKWRLEQLVHNGKGGAHLQTVLLHRIKGNEFKSPLEHNLKTIGDVPISYN